MPTFNAPTLIVDLSTTQYRSQLNQNFERIQAALIDIQNALGGVTGAAVPASNLTAIDRFLIPDGMLGSDSFFPTFSTDQDSLIVNHLQDGGFSSCVMNGLFHQTDEEFEKDFADIITSDGTYPVILGVRSAGYPNLTMRVLIEDTDNDVDLVLYRMDVTRTGSAWLVQNLRRAATVLLDRGSFSDVYDADLPLPFGLQGLVGIGQGPREAGVVAPWDLEVSGAWFRLGTAPSQTDGLEVEVRRGEGTDSESVLSGAASWSAAQAGDSVEVLAATPRVQVSAGEFLRVWVTVAEAIAIASDLYCTLLVRRLRHPIYR